MKKGESIYFNEPMRYEVYNKIIKRVIFESIDRKDCTEYAAGRPNLIVRKIKNVN